MMRLDALLSRADDETLQSLLGEAPMKLLLTLDPQLARPRKIRDLILRIHTADALLLSPDLRAILIDLLPRQNAEMLRLILQLPRHGGLYQQLRDMRIRRGSERERALFNFFGLSPPVIEYIEEKPSMRPSSGNYALFSYQRDAARKVLHALDTPPYRVLLHMPTGSGKTRTAMNIIAEHLRKSEPTLVIWLANTEEICEQSAAEFEKAWSHLGNRDVGIFRFWGNAELNIEDVRDGLLVGGLAKMYSATKQGLSFIMELAGRTSLVIIDEAHSAIAETYQLIIDTLTTMKRYTPSLLGLTATPGRTWADIEVDEQLSEFFSRRKVTLEIEDYRNPIDYLVYNEYLAQVRYDSLYYQGSADFSAADIRRVEQHLDIPADILRRLAEDEVRNLAIITKLEDLAKGHRRILVFAATVEHADILAAVLQMRGLDAKAINAKTPRRDRQAKIDSFKDDAPEVKILCNFGVLTTGFDAPSTSAALIARPTKSLVLYSQMVGRAIRGKRAGGNLSAEIVTVVDYNLPGFGSVAEAFNNWEDIWD